MVLFRSTTGAGAAMLLQGMIGANGISLPLDIMEHLGPFSQLLQPFVSASTVQSGRTFLQAIFWVFLLLAIALFLPNSLKVTARYLPALGIQPSPSDKQTLVRLFEWSPTLPWALVTAALAATTIIMWGGKSEFLYWQF
jgi:hypothetical protein